MIIKLFITDPLAELCRPLEGETTEPPIDIDYSEGFPQSMLRFLLSAVLLISYFFAVLSEKNFEPESFEHFWIPILYILGGVCASSFSGFFFHGTWRNLQNLFSVRLDRGLDAQTIRFVDVVSRGALYGACIYTVVCFIQALENPDQFSLIQQYLDRSRFGLFFAILFYLFLKTVQQKLIIKSPENSRFLGNQESVILGYALAGLFGMYLVVYLTLFVLRDCA